MQIGITCCLKKGQFHSLAGEFGSELEAEKRKPAASNFVQDETAALQGRRAGYHFAAK